MLSFCCVRGTTCFIKTNISCLAGEHNLLVPARIFIFTCGRRSHEDIRLHTRSHEVRSRTSAPHLSHLSTTYTFPKRHISRSNDTILVTKKHRETRKHHTRKITKTSTPTQNLKKMASPTQDPTTTTTGQQDQQKEEKPWHAAFPAPRLEAGSMPAARAQMVLSMKIASMLIIDVRRTDYFAGAIRGSLNIPAQGFWWNRGML
jgi:hypothetical protein